MKKRTGINVKICWVSLLLISLTQFTLFASGFTDDHNDGSLSGWTIMVIVVGQNRMERLLLLQEVLKMDF